MCRATFRGRMTVQTGLNFRRMVACAIAAIGLSLSAPALASNDEVPVDLDSPETIVDTVEAQAAVDAADAAAAAFARVTPGLAQRLQGQQTGDSQFRSLFTAIREMEGTASQPISIPSRRPVDSMTLTSSFGTRNDPFSGRRARHNGIDIPGPVGTPIYATADGTVGRAQRLGGYGNYVEIEHGYSLQTRYGHLSAIAVTSGQKVRRGDIIGYMGSTGRSTGSHLHYEVRIAGAPQNPLRFIEEDSVIVAAAGHGATALGGPRE